MFIIKKKISLGFFFQSLYDYISLTHKFVSRALLPVTQLYVSVDAATKESLKKIDRPLFRDYWERFLDSLKALSEKQQRTVYRLTLVKGWNTEELDNYASLISIGNPDFIEVKVCLLEYY